MKNNKQTGLMRSLCCGCFLCTAKVNIRRAAFTLMEVLLTLSIIAFLGLITLPVLNESLSAYSEKLSTVKADNNIKTIVNNLLNNSSYYPKHNFAYFAKDRSELDEEEYNKFRDAFKDSLINPRETKCVIIIGDGTSWNAKTEEAFCFIGTDNIIWGIPLTEFKTLKTMKTTVNGIDNYYVPITVYPNSSPEDVSDTTSIYENAVIYGLREDGKLIYLDDVIDEKITDAEERKETIHYLTQKYTQPK